MGIELDSLQLDRFEAYYREIVDWNRRINLTSVTEYEQVQTRHFLDSLAVSAVIPPETLQGGSLLDVGSGAGLPGMPLAIAHAGLNVALLDATKKKTTFLSHLIGILELDNVEVLTGRAETLAHEPELRERFDIVASRAVGRLPVQGELTLAFCRVGGLVIAQKALGAEDEIDAGGAAMSSLGGKLRDVTQVAVPESDVERLLVTIDKMIPTPSRYPRRPGIPSKRPL